eukprot:2532339-Pyramimonas_sp.AAC.1
MSTQMQYTHWKVAFQLKQDGKRRGHTRRTDTDIGDDVRDACKGAGGVDSDKRRRRRRQLPGVQLVELSGGARGELHARARGGGNDVPHGNNLADVHLARAARRHLKARVREGHGPRGDDEGRGRVLHVEAAEHHGHDVRARAGELRAGHAQVARSLLPEGGRGADYHGALPGHLGVGEEDVKGKRVELARREAGGQRLGEHKLARHTRMAVANHAGGSLDQAEEVRLVRRSGAHHVSGAALRHRLAVDAQRQRDDVSGGGGRELRVVHPG